MTTERRDLAVDVAVLASVPLSIGRTRSAVILFLQHLKVKKAVISVVFVKDAMIRRLNRERLGHDHVTDIITFNLSDKESSILEGELVISPGEARRNALACGEQLDREILRYLAHGLLHLKGYDDATQRQMALMRKKEDALLDLLA